MYIFDNKDPIKCIHIHRTLRQPYRVSPEGTVYMYLVILKTRRKF